MKEIKITNSSKRCNKTDLMVKLLICFLAQFGGNWVPLNSPSSKGSCVMRTLLVYIQLHSYIYTHLLLGAQTSTTSYHQGLSSLSHPTHAHCTRTSSPAYIPHIPTLFPSTHTNAALSLTCKPTHVSTALTISCLHQHISTDSLTYM